MAHLQTASPVQITTATPTITPAGSVTAGSLIVITITQHYAANPPRTITSVADSVNSGNYTLAKSDHTNGNVWVDVYYKIATATGTPTVTVTLSGVGNGELAMSVYDNAHTVLGPVSSASATATSVQPGSVSPSGTALYINSVALQYNYVSATQPAGWNSRSVYFGALDGSVPVGLMTADLIGSGAQNPTTTFGSSQTVANALVTFTANPLSRTGGTINAAGTQLTVTYASAVTHGAGGNGGVTLSATGGAVTATYASGAGTTSLVYNLSRTILTGETITQAYTQPGNGIELVSDGTDIPSYTSAAVTNGSTQAAPTLSSAAINTAGTQLTLTFSASVSIGAGGNGGVTLATAGAGVTPAYSSGSGSTALVYTLSRNIASGETLTVSYAQPGNGIKATSGGIDVGSFSGSSVTNNSTLVGPAITSVSSSSPARGSSLTITGPGGSTGYGATQGASTVVVAGQVSTATAWSDTSITVTTPDAPILDGVATSIVITRASTGLSSPSYALTGLQPQSGYSFVTIDTPHATQALRLYGTGVDLQSGNQIEWSTGTSVIVYSDGTASAPNATTFQARAGNADGWGSWATVTISLAGATSVVAPILHHLRQQGIA